MTEDLSYNSIPGLKDSEVADKLKNEGYNELPSSKPKNIFKIAFDVVKEPMFLLLITCGILYMLIGDYKEGIVLLCSIIIIISITFFQSQKTERALEALKNLSSPRALVRRNSIDIRIPGREVVRDDLLILNEGDRIPADSMIIHTTHLVVDESILTGESIPVNKSTAENENILYSGTLVVQGKAQAKVLKTGIHTKFGEIGVSIKDINNNQTRMQKELNILIRNLFIAGIFISISVILLYYFSRGNFLQATLNGLASAMAILPEEFPVVLTVFLALGSWRLSKKNVLTRNPSAIETLGSTTILCSDKTGTITQNKMEIAEIYTNAELFKKDFFSDKRMSLLTLLDNARMACPENSVDPMEKAIFNTFSTLYKTDKPKEELIKEFPITKEQLCITRITKQLKEDNPLYFVSCKGAPETILNLCLLDENSKTKHIQVLQQMASKGYRILGVCKANYTGQIPEEQSKFDFSFIGFIGFEDPIRPEVPQAISQCNEAGIKVMMITGDYPETAKSIALQIGLSLNGPIITGSEIDNMSDYKLQQNIRHITIFARVRPEQKLRIVKALKANNEIVTMTGDGVNDAPALKASDIGVAMGKKGTDVARESSSLVLLDDNFSSIVSAIRGGRRIFDNLQKAMSYILAIHIPIIGLTILPVFFDSMPILLLPLHIVFMELIIDPVCSIAFESEQEEKRIMQRPPRKSTDIFFGKRKIIKSVLKGFFLFVMVTTIYFLSLNEGHSEGEIRAITFSSLILGNVFLILSSLSKTRSFASIFMESNYSAIMIIAIALLLLSLILTVPPLLSLFNFDFPGFYHLIPSALGAIILLFILETAKLIAQRRVLKASPK